MDEHDVFGADRHEIPLVGPGGEPRFLNHATCYLYFFVDDEGITMVYARSLLEGRGLTYAATEGPVEGYSNFLHIVVMAGTLRA